MPKLTILVAATLCWVSLQAQQQPSRSPDQDEAAIFEQIKTTVRYETDGTGRRELYMRVKVQSEAGVQGLGQVVLGYNAATERIDLHLIRVRKADGSVVDTPAEGVQDLSSPVERIAPVYTDFRQKHITVQSLRPGDTLEVRVVTTIHTALAPGQFWTEHAFNDDAIVLDEQLDIDVPAARQLIVKLKPGFEPQIEQAGDRRKYHWSHAHAAREKESDEQKEQAARHKKATDEPDRAPIRLTTFADWNAVGSWFANLERTARTPNPQIQQKARELIAGRTTDIAKLEALYDFVSKNFRYVSLSLGAGRYQPRAAADVLRDAYGDCKDKHTLLASLLDAVGLQASAVLINSTVKLDPDFPSPGQFNHVITRVVADGRDVWVDATPEVAPFRLLSPNLRRKQALLVDAAASRLLETPADPPMPSLIGTDVDGAIDDAGALSARVTLTFRGDSELFLRSAFRATPAAQWQQIVDQIAQHGAASAKVSEMKISDPQTTGTPFTVAFRVDATGFTHWSAGKVDLSLPYGQNSEQEEPPVDDSAPVVVGAPGDVVYTLKLKLPQAAKVRTPVPVAVVRDYAEYRASYAATGSIVSAERRLVIRQSEIAGARAADHSAFVRVLTGDARQRLSVDAAALASSDTPVAAGVRATELNQAGYQALRDRDYSRAITLLKRVVELEPKDRTAWNNLGRAYMGVNEVDSAIASYQKQIDIDPYDAYAYNNLGMAYVAKSRFTDAERAYTKQLEVNPLDKYAPANLGRLYVSQQQYAKAAPVLEKAAALAPESAVLQVQLGKAYLNLQRSEDARKAFARAVEIDPAPGTWNDVAYELALGRLDLARAQQYAESALAATSAASRNIDIENGDARALALANSLGAYWDTLGWVYFASGDLATAEKYVSASWNLSQHAEVGDHLGQILEKTGRRDAAAAMYARAISAARPAAAVRTHLEHAAGQAARADALVEKHRGDLSRSRTYPLPVNGPAGKTAEFFVLFTPRGVEAVHFISGADAMRAIGTAIEKMSSAAMFPDQTPAKILRRGIAGCAADGRCSFTLLLPEDAKPAK